mmetsp:Transcript_22974/g.58351  ORF Transcript_22974/g.58351 Transcript_22974/m.58351 type:complete len:156 (-) Transcript_22974:78-545(-)
MACLPMLTPYDGNNLSPDKDSFNFFQSHYRINIECAVGMLQRRFEILRRDLEVDTHRVGHIVKACMLIHNLCIDSRDFAVSPEPDDSAHFEHGLDLLSDQLRDGPADNSAGRGIDVPMRIRMRNRLMRLGKYRSARSMRNSRGAARSFFAPRATH